MACTNCFSGCVETTSDKCVKYTGSSIEFLGINTGDTLESVEKAITDYLATVLTGEGISPTIDPSDLCTIVSQYFPVGDPTMVDILVAVIKAICDIEDEIVVERGRIDDLEDEYDTDCLTADSRDGTHAILQEVITRLCTAIDDITTLENLFATCITTRTINTYIQNYINTQSTSNYWYTKMVPYVIYPFYPNTVTANSFSASGAGLGTWDKVFLCNGNNGTPDLRGRSLIGATNGMGGGSFDEDVDPGLGNPDYGLGTTGGKNTIVLSEAQMAAHTHNATAEVTDPGHATSISVYTSQTAVSGADSYYPVTQIETVKSSNPQEAFDGPATATTSLLSETGVTVAVTNDPNEGGGAHDNVHPVYACYYVMYIP